MNKILKILGYSRVNAFKDEYEFNQNFFPEISLLDKYKKKYKRIIAWMLTHRSQLNKNILDLINESKMNVKVLNNFLLNNNFVLIMKPHFLELNIFQDLFEKQSSILLYKASGLLLLNYTDILISDYSSVFFDFLNKKVA